MDDLEHIAELQDLMKREVAHEGDSVIYVRLAMRAMEVNKLCKKLLRFADPDTEAVDTLMIEETVIVISMFDSKKITDEQRVRLFDLLTEDMTAYAGVHEKANRKIADIHAKEKVSLRSS